MAEIMLKIPNEKWPEFRTGYLNFRPIPLDSYGKPIMLVKDWIPIDIKKLVFRVYKMGKKKLAGELAIIDENIIE